MFLAQLNIRNLKSVILSDQLGDLVFKGISHREVQFLLTFKLLQEVMIELFEVSLLGVAVDGANVIPLIFQLSSVNVHSFSDETISNQGIRARFLNLFFDKKIERVLLLFN